MAPPNQLGKRVKLTQVRRPFIVGSTALPFSETNPRPAGVPDNHTHSWQVFVKGVEDTDITYWLRRVQFKLHESIPNYVRMVDGEPGKPFIVNETGWGEFDIAIKLYYVNDSGEKPQTLYHYLRLHPYGRTEEEKQAMIMENGEIRSWSYEEQLFNEPFDVFYRILTSGARTAMIPNSNRPGQPFSRETEAAEVKKLRDAQTTTEEWSQRILQELKGKEDLLAKLKAENAAAAAAPKPS
ncbi:unnamed protein product [Clonostachys rosea f. rosea IK726]|uniref:Protein AF-9 homolog n=2 Tax=Bionectria ochroleuca TaxID=29856 RepID=A0A0B7JPS2_BIOOC|nr:unnamed protein product [Clonostachys rosea f. rosea IK726]